MFKIKPTTVSEVYSCFIGTGGTEGRSVNGHYEAFIKCACTRSRSKQLKLALYNCKYLGRTFKDTSKLNSIPLSKRIIQSVYTIRSQSAQTYVILGDEIFGSLV